MIPKQTSRLRTWLKRLGLSLLAVLLFVGLIYALGWYSDWKEQRQLDEMLAELDRTEPGWRWKDFLPTPLQPGQENGALRFIEFGKTIDLKRFESDLDDEPLAYYDPPTWLQRLTFQKWYKQVLGKTKTEQ